MDKKKLTGRFIINLGARNKNNYRAILDTDLKTLGPVIGPEVEPFITYIGDDSIVVLQEEFDELLDTIDKKDEVIKSLVEKNSDEFVSIDMYNKQVDNYNEVATEYSELVKKYIDLIEANNSLVEKIKKLESNEKSDDKLKDDYYNMILSADSKVTELKEENKKLKEELDSYKKADLIKFNETSTLYIGSNVSIISIPETIPEAIKEGICKVGEESENHLIKGVIINIRVKGWFSRTEYERDIENEIYDVRLEAGIVLEGLKRENLINLDI